MEPLTVIVHVWVIWGWPNESDDSQFQLGRELNHLVMLFLYNFVYCFHEFNTFFGGDCCLSPLSQCWLLYVFPIWVSGTLAGRIYLPPPGNRQSWGPWPGVGWKSMHRGVGPAVAKLKSHILKTKCEAQVKGPGDFWIFLGRSQDFFWLTCVLTHVWLDSTICTCIFITGFYTCISLATYSVSLVDWAYIYIYI